MVPQYIDYTNNLKYYNVQKFIYYNLDIERLLGPQWGQLITLTDIKSGKASDYIVCGFLDYLKYDGLIIKAVNHDNFFHNCPNVPPLNFKAPEEEDNEDFVIVPKLSTPPRSSAYCLIL